MRLVKIRVGWHLAVRHDLLHTARVRHIIQIVVYVVFLVQADLLFYLLLQVHGHFHHMLLEEQVID